MSARLYATKVKVAADAKVLANGGKILALDYFADDGGGWNVLILEEVPDLVKPAAPVIVKG